jgi:hypothetical protein
MKPECNLYRIEIPGVEGESFSMTTPARKTEALDNGRVKARNGEQGDASVVPCTMGSSCGNVSTTSE